MAVGGELIRGMSIALAVALATLPQRAECRSQQPIHTSKRGSVDTAHVGRITGVVIDSLDGRGLADADVLAEGKTVKVTRTDATGSFSIQAVQPGTYRITVSHPLLETLGVLLITP